MQSIVADSLRYIRNGDATEELYRLAADRWETENLAARDSAGLNTLRAVLRRIKEER
jgi:hypothetical protein